MTEVCIHIERKAYPTTEGGGELCVIGNLELDIKAHEFVCLVGPSGCGKTTLLNIIAGLDCDFDGTIHLTNGSQTPVIGYVFQTPRLLPWRNVRENIELVLASNQDLGQVDTLLTIMGLEQFQDYYPERLSLGMSRRVALARAFAVEPDLLLLDEPFVSLDAPTGRRIRQLLWDVWCERPHSVLFVTHDLREAIGLADRLLFLSARPAGLVAEIAVDIPRDQRRDEKEIEDFRRRIMENHREIKGLL